jgi:hypothetical protein
LREESVSDRQRRQGERVASGGRLGWRTGALVAFILLVGGPLPLYGKKVNVPVGARASRSESPSLARRAARLALPWQALTRLLLGLVVAWLHASQVGAQAGETAPVTTWAVRIAAGSRCSESQAFANTVSAQIPAANRAPEERAELVAEVNLLDSGIARVRVFDRVLQAEAGARELQLHSRSCDESAEAVALVLAVLVEAGRGALSSPPATAVSPPPPPAPPPPPPPVPPPVPIKRAEPRHVWLGPRAGHDLSAAVGVGYGLLPGAALGGSVGWGIRSPKLWPIWLQVTGFRKPASADISARFSTIYAGVMGCPLSASWGRIRGRACASAAVGALWAEGVGLRQNYAKTRELYVVGIELAGNVRLVGPLELTTMLRGDGYPKRYLFNYSGPNGNTWLHKPKPVSASVFAGLALRFR